MNLQLQKKEHTCLEFVEQAKSKTLTKPNK